MTIRFKKRRPVPVRLGVIGCGVISDRHMMAAKDFPAAKVVAAADLREERVRAFAEKHGVPFWTTSARALIARPDVDAVILAMPAAGRAALAIEAFRRGKHVLVEKPVAMDSREVEAMIRARGRLVGACCSSRFRATESAAIATRFLARGALGRLRELRCRGVAAAGPRRKDAPPAWRLIRAMNGGGILMNWGCYDLDYLLGLLSWKLRPETAFARTWPVAPHLARGRVAPGSDAETHVSALVTFQGGAVLDYERAEFFAGPSENAWQIIGEKGSLSLTMVPGVEASLVHYEAVGTSGVRERVLWKGESSYAVIHAGPIRGFVGAIRRGPPAGTTLEHALVVQRITDAIYRSATTGRVERVGQNR